MHCSANPNPSACASSFCPLINYFLSRKTQVIKPLLQKAALCAGLTLLGLNIASADTLKIGTEGGSPPWSMVDAAGKVSGFAADIGNALCKELNADCRFVVQSFDRLIPSLAANRLHLLLSGISVTPDTSKLISFSFSNQV